MIKYLLLLFSFILPYVLWGFSWESPGCLDSEIIKVKEIDGIGSVISKRRVCSDGHFVSIPYEIISILTFDGRYTDIYVFENYESSKKFKSIEYKNGYFYINMADHSVVIDSEVLKPF